MTFTYTETHEERFRRLITEAKEYGEVHVPRTIERDTALAGLYQAQKFANLDIDRKLERVKRERERQRDSTDGPGWPE